MKKNQKFSGFLFKIILKIGMKKNPILWVIFRFRRKHFFICDGKS
jgi:hypothetical protein